ncbi:MAG: YidC/Oxa1 family membrane protein insertase [Actinomycetota bacterium]|nr:YidC/Oxa1 family membrane protein insertase [Actinomycetota bacterium]
MPTVKQSAVRWAVATVPDALARLVRLSERAETTLAGITDLQPEIDRLTRRHEGDRERLNEELMRLFKEADLNPLGACLPMVLRALPGFAISCVLYGPVLQGSQRQALHDRFAGTVVIEAR